MLFRAIRRIPTMMMANQTSEARHTILDLRKATGLSQAAFGEMYHIPKRTLQNWEQSVEHPESTNAREIPDWALYMLTRLVKIDFPGRL